MRDQPFDVPAEGVVRYQYFVVDSGFTEDKWFNVAEVIPSDPSVVHHVSGVCQGPNDRTVPGEGGLFGFSGSLRTGFETDSLPRWHGQTNSRKFENRLSGSYTPNGTKHQDMTKLGLSLVDPTQ